MIGKLTGIVDENDDNNVIIDVGGVGYLVFCSANTLRFLPEKGESTSLIIETHVREDHIHLYGFSNENERQWFKILLVVSGVGTKMAMSILSSLTPQQLATAIISQDKAAFQQVSGVGPKLAARLVTELKDKKVAINDASYSQNISIAGGTDKTSNTSASAQRDAVSALTNLGYGRSEAYAVAMKIASENDGISAEELIKACLQEMAGN